MLKSIIAKYQKPLRFIISGGSAAAVEYGVFLLLLWVIHQVLIANTISFLCGLIVSYLLNRLWVFDSSAGIKKQFGMYFTLAMINLVLSNVVLFGLTDWLSLSPVLAKIAVMAGIAGSNYFIFSKLIFKK